MTARITNALNKLKLKHEEERDVEKQPSGVRTPNNELESPIVTPSRQKRKSLTNIFEGNVFSNVFKGFKTPESGGFSVETELFFDLVTPEPKLDTKISIRNMVLSNSLEQQSKVTGNMDMNRKENIFKSRWCEISGQNLIIYNKKQGKERLRFSLQDITLEIIGEMNITHYKEKDNVIGHVFSLQLPDKKLIFSLPTKEEFKNWVESFYIIELKNFATITDPEVITKREQVEARVNDQHKIIIEDTSLIDVYGKERYTDLTNMYKQKLEEIKGV